LRILARSVHTKTRNRDWFHAYAWACLWLDFQLAVLSVAIWFKIFVHNDIEHNIGQHRAQINHLICALSRYQCVIYCIVFSFYWKQTLLTEHNK